VAAGVDETVKYPDIGDIRTPDLIDTGSSLSLINLPAASCGELDPNRD